jgi:hypothetical protein
MVLYDLHRVWDDVPFYGKAIAATAVGLHILIIFTWVTKMRREVQKHKND